MNKTMKLFDEVTDSWSRFSASVWFHVAFDFRIIHHCQLHPAANLDSTMLLSPARIHADLSNITSPSDTSYPHTALLITPAGQIMSWVSTPPGYDYYDEQDPNTNGNGHEDGEGDEEAEEEPWLDTPERLRLILGLVAEFTEGSISKVESEVRPLQARV
jgi:hypothetical protein